MPDTEPTLLSTFAGLGGLDLGLEAAGFRSLGYLETDAVARESLAANRPDWIALPPNDVHAASKTLAPAHVGLKVRELGMLCGGPPCQPFSKAAQWSHRAMRGLQDPRAKCLSGMMKLLDAFLPRVLLIENVEGFVQGRTSALTRVKGKLGEINRRRRTNYQLQHWLIDAADYGVPQHRRRAILFAERDGRSLTLPPATHADVRVTGWDALSALNDDGKAPPPLRHWGELLPSIPEGQNYLYHTNRGGGLPLFGYRTRFWSFLLKLAKDRPSWTLPAQPGPYTGPFHWDNRPLTIPELLRLQSFPASWVVTGSRREQVRQVGNATPPLLAEVIARGIRDQIFGDPLPGGPRLTISFATSPRPDPAPVLQVAPKFRRMRGEWPSHPGTGLGPRPLPAPQARHGKTQRKTSTAATGGSKRPAKRSKISPG